MRRSQKASLHILFATGNGTEDILVAFHVAKYLRGGVISKYLLSSHHVSTLSLLTFKEFASTFTLKSESFIPVHNSW